MITAKYNKDITFKVIQLKGDSDWRVNEYCKGEWQNSYDDNWNHNEAVYQAKRLAQGFEFDLIIE
jgi:hypothetical protein|tara:strand:+ start:313 stop:507 length:195 start_codon:yes stop_codon:yes gene_type:complete